MTSAFFWIQRERDGKKYRRAVKAQFPLQRHDTTRLVANFPVTSPRTCWRQVGDLLRTCYGQVANLLTTGAVGVPTRHVTTLITVIY